MNITDTITARRSVRSFDGRPLPATDRQLLCDFAASAENPFGGTVTIKMREFDLQSGYRPSTYGMIRGASDYFLIGFGDDMISELSAGFIFEQVVLKAREMGYGTCWIGATFKGTVFDSGMTWPEGERLRIVCPVGVAASRSLMERIVRMTARSDRRKPFGELFFSDFSGTPLAPESRFGEALSMMRLAPSSVNSQPWRAITDGTAVHFYCRKTNEFSMIDCGIGLSHFALTERHNGHSGTFVKLNAPAVTDSGWHYVISYQG